MNNLIKELPIPISGLMLGILALGNLIQDYSFYGKYICGIIGLIILILLLSKLIKFPEETIKSLKNPVIASVSATSLMSLIIISSYIAPFNIKIAARLWIFSVLLFVGLIIYFTIEFFIKRFSLENVYASYYIIYIGIVIASTTAPLYNQIQFGQIIFYFGLLSFIFLLILTLYRYLKLETPDMFKPLICINAAPFSLLLLGYLKSFSNISNYFIIFLYIMAIIFYIFSIIKIIEYRNLNFYPSYSAFAFPFVVAAIATKEMLKYSKFFYLNYLSYIQTLIAIILVSYVLVKYIIFLNKKTINNSKNNDY